MLEAMRRTIGPEHPDTLALMSSLAKGYYDLGRLQDSIKLGEEDLEARMRTLGAEHSRTLLSISNLQFYLEKSYHSTK